MSADVLRRAAKVLREHAMAVPGTMTGPWFIRAGCIIADDGTDVGMLVLKPYQPADDGPLMAFVALMHPPVALALAAWLEAEADSTPANADDWESVMVARAILREQP